MTMLRNTLRTAFTNEVIRAAGALARQQEVCREQEGQVVFVTGMDAAREYLVEQVLSQETIPKELYRRAQRYIDNWNREVEPTEPAAVILRDMLAHFAEGA